jgi:RNA polymerase sigma-70 factor (ECF subfamily)
VDEPVDQIASDQADPLAEVDRQQAGRRVLAAIDELPDPFREVVVLRCAYGFSYQEMAQVVGCPAGTVMSRLARARAMLRRALGPVRLAVAGAGRP